MSDANKDSGGRPGMASDPAHHTPAQAWLEELQDTLRLTRELRERTEHGVPFRTPSISRPF